MEYTNFIGLWLFIMMVCITGAVTSHRITKLIRRVAELERRAGMPPGEEI